MTKQLKGRVEKGDMARKRLMIVRESERERRERESERERDCIFMKRDRVRKRDREKRESKRTTVLDSGTLFS